MINPQIATDLLLAQTTGAQPQQPPAVQVSLGPPVGSTTTTEHLGSDTTVKDKVMNQAAREAIDLTRAGVAQQIDAQKAINAYEEQKRSLEAQELEQKDQLLKARMAEEERQRAEYAAELDSFKKNQEQARLAMRQADQETGRSYMDDWGTARRVLHALTQGAAAGAATRSGGPNYALEIWRDAQQRDRAQRVSKAKAAADEYARTTGDITGARQRFNDNMQEIVNRQLLQNERVQNMIQLQIKKLPGAAANGEKMLAALTTQQGQLLEEQAGRWAQERSSTSHAPTQTTVTGEAPGSKMANKPTESEAKLALLGRSMKDELENIKKLPALSASDLSQVQKDTLKSEGADIASEKGGQLAAGAIGIGRDLDLIPKSRYSSLPEPKQQTLNAWDNAIEKYARMLTGAGMPAEEARRMARQNGPMAGDSPGVIESKLARLEREADRMISLSGQGAQGRLAGTPSKPQAAPQRAIQRPPSSDRDAIAAARNAGLQMAPDDIAALRRADSQSRKNPRDEEAQAVYRIIRNKYAPQMGGAE